MHISLGHGSNSVRRTISARNTVRYQILRMTKHLDDPIIQPAPRALTEVLDASVRDIAAGHVADATTAQDEARRMLAAFETARSGVSTSPVGGKQTRAKTA
jgi:hypothetical protein